MGLFIRFLRFFETTFSWCEGYRPCLLRYKILLRAISIYICNIGVNAYVKLEEALIVYCNCPRHLNIVLHERILSFWERRGYCVYCGRVRKGCGVGAWG
jgi:hypothetical protein